jgi:hypothetical protein
VVEQIDRLEAQYERRIAMLFEDDGRKECGLETVRCSRIDDATKTAQRLAADLGVVRQGVEPRLNGIRRSQARNEAALLRRERKPRRIDRISARERARR